MSDWTLMRLGHDEASYALQPHLHRILVGRAPKPVIQLQLLGKQISRQHLQFLRCVEGSRVYWQVEQLSATSKTFLNHVEIRARQPIRLNDRDVLSFHERLTSETAKGEKRKFLYQILAPTKWAESRQENQEDEDVEANAATPPPQLPTVTVQNTMQESSTGTDFKKSSSSGCDSRKRTTSGAKRQLSFNTTSSQQPSVKRIKQEFDDDSFDMDVESAMDIKEEPAEIPKEKPKKLLDIFEDGSDKEIVLEKKSFGQRYPDISQHLKVHLTRMKEPPSNNVRTAKIGKAGIIEWIQPKVQPLLLGHDLDALEAVSESDSDMSTSLLDDTLEDGEIRERKKKKKKRINRIDSDNEESTFSSFSQVEEVISIDSDSEYFQSSQAFDLDKIKQEKVDDGDQDEEEESQYRKSRYVAYLDEEISSEEDDDDVIFINDDEDLESSQTALFQKILLNIKQEPKSPKAEVATHDEGGDESFEAQVSSETEEGQVTEDSEEDTQLLDQAFEEEVDAKDGNEDHQALKDEEEEHEVIATVEPEPEKAASDVLPELPRNLLPPRSLSSASFGPPKPVRVIEALPMPQRRRRKSGKISGEGNASEKPAEIVPSSFYGSKTTKAVPTSGRDAWKAAGFKSKEQIQEERKQKLKEIAEKSKKEEEGTKEKARPPTKMKQSEPKLMKLMREPTEITKPSKDWNSRMLQRRKSEEEGILKGPLVKKMSASRDRSPQKESREMSPPRPSTSAGFLEDEAREDAKMAEKSNKPRTKAELRRDHDGQMVIKKLSFSNMISNVGSQQLEIDTSRPKRVLSYECVKAKLDNKENKKKKEKKAVRWKLDKNGRVLVHVRYVAKEGKGRQVQQAHQTEIDRTVFAKITRNKILPQHLSPAVMKPTVTRNHHGGFTFDEMLYKILKWAPIWLKEQTGKKEAPPVHGHNLKLSHVPPIFDSFRSYSNTFLPLMLHELWYNVYTDYTEFCDVHCPNVMMCVTNEARKDERFIYLNLIGLLTPQEAKSDSYLPGDGYLVTVDLRVTKCGDAREQIRPVFGYVNSSRVRRRMDYRDGYYAQVLEKEAIAERRKRLLNVIEISIVLKRLGDDLQLNMAKPIFVKGVARIKADLRHFEALESICESKLFSNILKPRPECFYQGAGADDIRPDVSKMLKHLNEYQLKAVRSVARNMTTNMDTPQVALIQGPPGTGKTKTICSIILQIFSRWRHFYPGLLLPRILLAAPSNAAVDEILIRLMAIQKDLSKEANFTMMRIGREKVVHEKVRTIRLEVLREMEVNAKMANNSNMGSVKLEISQRQQSINQLGEKLKTLNGNDAAIELTHRQIKEETELLNRAKNTKPSKEEYDKYMREATEDLLEHADVIATTLSSSMNAQMAKYFLHTALQNTRANQNHRRFAICIIDEATQCVEPEALIPFRLGFCKLVLVGDPEQLSATVTSVQAKKLSYDVSLFKRLFDHFEKSPDQARNPIHKLMIQYRMHSEICRWPNKYHYGGVLKNGPQKRESLLHPYLVLDLKEGATQKDGARIFNKVEAAFVARLTRYVREELKKKAVNLYVGVITFYSKQKEVIRVEMNKLGMKDEVPVRTVDGFQGSERDVIIVSCVRSGNVSQNGNNIGFVAEEERLNVALTRAKSALIIVGNMDTFKQNKMWQDLIQDAKSRRLMKEVSRNTNFACILKDS